MKAMRQKIDIEEKKRSRKDIWSTVKKTNNKLITKRKESINTNR